MTAVVFASTFPAWLTTLDLRLLEQTGRVFADLPIPEAVAWEWYARGLAARDVADRLVDRAVKIRQATICRVYGDDPRRMTRQ